MTIGIFAKTFPAPPLAACLDQVVAHRIEVIHFNLTCAGLPSLPREIPDEAADRIGAAVRERGLTMAGVSATYNMIHPDPAVREAGLAGFGELARVSARLGTRLLTLCTGTRDLADQWRRHSDNDAPAAWRDLLYSLEAALDIAEQYDLLLGVEPEPANVVCDAAAARRLFDEMASPLLRIILDPANLFTQAEPPAIRRLIAEAVDLLGDTLIMAHAKDRTCTGQIRPAGKGDVDFRFFIRTLKEAGFDGPLVLHDLGPEEVEESMAFLHRLM